MVAHRLQRPVEEVMSMHPRDLATLLDLYEEDIYQAGEPAREQERRRMHGLD